jgi:hypothetical protein
MNHIYKVSYFSMCGVDPTLPLVTSSFHIFLSFTFIAVTFLFWSTWWYLHYEFGWFFFKKKNKTWGFSPVYILDISETENAHWRFHPSVPRKLWHIIKKIINYQYIFFCIYLLVHKRQKYIVGVSKFVGC